MKNMNLEVMKLINEGLSIVEISNQLHIDYKRLSEILKNIRNNGYNLQKKYFSDGTIIPIIKKDLSVHNRSRININTKDSVFNAIFISDLHFGSLYDNPALLNIVYEYALKHNIHVIFNAGDLIENVYPINGQQLKNDTPDSQIKKVLRLYPYDPSIINFILYGNHDHLSIKYEGLDIGVLLENKRYDLISLGFEKSVIKLRADSIGITHNIHGNQGAPDGVSITFKGHSHKSKNSFKDNKIVYVPSLSDYIPGTYEYPPLACFLDVEFIFVGQFIERVNIKQLAIVNHEIRLANEEALILKKVPPKKYNNKKDKNEVK